MSLPLSLRRAGEHRAECYRCFKPQVTCICRTIERVANRTSITILQHPRERFHAIGTVRIARLGLAKIYVEPCAPWADASALGEQLPEGTALLYPTPASQDLATLPVDERPRHLLILDGTWFQAKKIYDAQPWLHALPHVRLSTTDASRYGSVRREPKAGYVATVEAIVHALHILEPQTRGLDGLLRSFSAMIEQHAAYLPES